MNAQFKNISFRKLQSTDINLVWNWLNRAHVAKWYRSEPTFEDQKIKLLNRINMIEPTSVFIVQFAGKDIGYIQTYRIDDYQDYQKEISFYKNACGIDMFIGEEKYLHQGIGATMIIKFLNSFAFILTNTSICILGPNPNNSDALKAYKKSGFKHLKTVITHDGEEYLMTVDKKTIQEKFNLLRNNAETAALDWACNYLIDEFESNFEYEAIAATTYSNVYKIQATNDCFYLKQTPQALFTEPAILNFLAQHSCKNIPTVIATNSNLCCFLMKASGDISLRKYFNGNIDLDILKQGITNYTTIQRSMEKYTTDLLDLGVPDWRLDKFPTLYYQLIQQEQLLLDDGLSKTEIVQLQQLHSTCLRLCDKLAQYKIPETIGHCDFHENNMLLDQKNFSINIIDWGETAITHPFFSLQGCLWQISYFYNVQLSDSKLRELQKQCIAPWLNIYSEIQLLQALTVAGKLNGIFAALGFARLYVATKNQLRLEHNCPIAGCLRSFLQAIEHEKSWSAI